MKLSDLNDSINEGETNPYKKYPRAFFPKTKAENMRTAAKKRLDRMKNKKNDSGGGDSNIGGPVGSGVDY